MAHSIRAAERYGESEEKMKAVLQYRTSALFSEAERVALDFAVAAASTPNQVSAEISSSLKEHWDEGEVVEILGVIALFGYLNRWNDSMGTVLEEPAVESGETLIESGKWDRGKHV